MGVSAGLIEREVSIETDAWKGAHYWFMRSQLDLLYLKKL